ILNTKNNRDTLIFFPDDEYLTGHSYYEFKILHILRIISENNGDSKINIYDDRFQYFDVIKERLEKNAMDNVEFHRTIKPKEFWNIRHEEYINLIKLHKTKRKNNKNKILPFR
ncbi:hypothetical protein LCGC14_1344620, partial [marine sediment metagenome]